MVFRRFSQYCRWNSLAANATKVHKYDHPDLLGSSMDEVYDWAAKLVKRTLDVEGVIVMDVLH